jgi:cyclopropane fatty-acyl-phospholipid synthase-like methyltransferase
MLLDSILNLLGRHAPPPGVLAPSPAALHSIASDAPLADDDDKEWPSARIAVAEALWGEGHLAPGGDEEVLHIAKPLGLSEAASLLLLGAGVGGPSCCLAGALGAWVSGFEANAHLVEQANARASRRGLGRRARVDVWEPKTPAFAQHYFHHAMALEALRYGAAEPVLGAITRALQPGGQVVLVEVVADPSLDRADRTVATWLRLEGRDAAPPGELVITRLLQRLGFDVRVVEDISRRHLHQVIGGWQAVARALEDQVPAPRQMAVLVREAELWLHRFRLMHAGRLRLVRWHAIGRGGVALP